MAYYRQQAEQAQEQVRDMETNLSINKEIIKNLLDSIGNSKAATTGVTDDTSPVGNPPTLLSKLQQSLKSLQGEYVNQ